jgi:hypothetical protein
MIIFMGCCINICGWPLNAKYERTVYLSAPMKPGSTFAAQTHNGSITIEGAETADCNLVATIVAHAITEEDAQKLAEEINVKLETEGSRLTAKIEQPTIMMNRSVSVSLKVVVPSKTDLELTTHNGAVNITNIAGEINAITHNGGVAATQVAGDTKLKSHNGSITCKEILGDAQLETHNGGVKVYYSEAAQPVCNVLVVTHNGGVEFAAPPNFSAAVEASTHNGSIRTDLPITLSGEVSRGKLTGTIGTGQGKLHLETHNGSIRIKSGDLK